MDSGSPKSGPKKDPPVYTALSDHEQAQVDQILGHKPGYFGKRKMAKGEMSSEEREFHAKRVQKGLPGGDLFQEENIVGYTGDPNDPGSIYYMNRESRARITRHHDEPRNVGKSPTRPVKDYAWKNEGVFGAKQVEFEDGKKTHTSRTKRTVVGSEKEQKRLHDMTQQMPNQGRKKLYDKPGYTDDRFK